MDTVHKLKLLRHFWDPRSCLLIDLNLLERVEHFLALSYGTNITPRLWKVKTVMRPKRGKVSVRNQRSKLIHATFLESNIECTNFYVMLMSTHWSQVYASSRICVAIMLMQWPYYNEMHPCTQTHMSTHLLPPSNISWHLNALVQHVIVMHPRYYHLVIDKYVFNDINML